MQVSVALINEISLFSQCFATSVDSSFNASNIYVGICIFIYNVYYLLNLTSRVYKNSYITIYREILTFVRAKNNILAKLK